MTYKGIEIGATPTIEMFYEYASRMGFDLDIPEVYEQYKNRNFMTLKHQPFKTLETLINAANGAVIYKKIKNGVAISKKDSRFIVPPPIYDKSKSPKDNYDIFLQSSYWYHVRKIKIEQTGCKCQVCGSNQNLNVHHNTYVHHYSEHKHLEDLIVLCRECHSKFHDKLKD